MSKFQYLLFVVLYLFLSSNIYAALSLDSTRYIYSEGENSRNIVITNQSDEVFAAQLWVETQDGDTKTKFIVIPSFFKIEPKSSQTARIIKVSDGFDSYQESLHWLNLQEIPPKRKGSGISMAIRTMVKLIYRPSELIDGRDSAEQGIYVKTSSDVTTISNNTPYIFAIGNIYDDQGQKIDVEKDVIGQLSTFLPGESVAVQSPSIGWVNAINDYGRISKYKLKSTRSD